VLFSRAPSVFVSSAALFHFSLFPKNSSSEFHAIFLYGESQNIK
jgi:hypothetical protein